MLKSFYWQAFRLVVLTLLAIQVLFHFNSALAQEVQSTKTASPAAAPVEMPVGGQPRESQSPQPVPSRESEVQPATSKPQAKDTKPATPYDMEAVEKFNEELYGEGN